MIKRNLRLRIAATIAGVCIVVVAMLGAAFYEVAEQMEAALLNQMLSEEVNSLIRHQQANPNHVPASTANVQYYVVKHPADELVIPEFARTLLPGQYEIDIGEGRGDRDVVVRQLGNVRYLVIYNLGEYEEREHEFRQIIAASLAIALVLTLVLGYVLAGYLTRQLQQLAREVDGIAGGTQVPLVKPAHDSEVAVLAEAMDRYQSRIAEILRREQEFTANVSHELRTPLTMIATSCELLVKDDALSEKSRERIGYIAQAVAQMVEHTEGLLFLGREQRVMDYEEVSLHECARDVAAPMQSEIAGKALALELDIPGDATLPLNRHALQLVLANLLRNAVRYTEQGHVRVSYAAHRLSVSDSGAGISADEVARIFERNYRGSHAMDDHEIAKGRHGSAKDGYGIGLDIVKRICDRAGWHIEVSSQPAVGSTFTLHLAPSPR